MECVLSVCRPCANSEHTQTHTAWHTVLRLYKWMQQWEMIVWWDDDCANAIQPNDLWLSTIESAQLDLIFMGNMNVWLSQTLNLLFLLFSQMPTADAIVFGKSKRNDAVARCRPHSHRRLPMWLKVSLEQSTRYTRIEFIGHKSA